MKDSLENKSSQNQLSPFDQKKVVVKNLNISNELPFTFIGGPCQIESRDHALKMADFISKLCAKNDIPFIFKASFDKANRTSVKGIRGIGMEKAIAVFEEIKKEFGCPVLTDIHNEEQCKHMGAVVDVLQVPAFLCRQTDLLEAACTYGKCVNVKKGQFLSPSDMQNVTDKCSHFKNENILLTERGSCFGYNNLIVDMTGLPILTQTGCPIIIDATHAVQKPGGKGTSSGGNRDMAMIIAKAAIASGPIGGVFCEVHDDPDNAFSDGPNSLNFPMLEKLLPTLKKIDGIVKEL